MPSDGSACGATSSSPGTGSPTRPSASGCGCARSPSTPGFSTRCGSTGRCGRSAAPSARAAAGCGSSRRAARITSSTRCGTSGSAPRAKSRHPRGASTASSREPTSSGPSRRPNAFWRRCAARGAHPPRRSFSRIRRSGSKPPAAEGGFFSWWCCYSLSLRLRFFAGSRFWGHRPSRQREIMRENIGSQNRQAATPRRGVPQTQIIKPGS